MTEIKSRPPRGSVALSQKAVVMLAMAATAIVSAAIFWGQLQRNTPPILTSPVTIALPTQINSASMLVAFGQGLFQKAGVSVVNQPFLLGKDALKSLLDGKADLAIVADVPVMFALNSGSDIAILAGISQARKALAVVARSDRSIANMQDLKGKTLALTKGANFPYFLDAMLQVNKIPSESVTLVDMKTPDAIAAFTDGKVDAAVVFQPFLAQMELSMGAQMKVFYGEDVYAFRFLLVGRPAYIDGHPQEIRRILSALAQANQSIADNQVAARQLVGAAVKVDDAVMSKLFDPADYVLSLDQAMLLALDDQTRWAMQSGLVKEGPVPNYLRYIKHQDLEAVNPAAVKIVR